MKPARRPVHVPVMASLLLGAAAVLAAGCRSSGKAPADSGGAGTGGGGGLDAASDAGGACPQSPDLTAPSPTCNTVTNGAPSIPFTARTGSPPPWTGGAIREGLYYATAAEGYGAAPQSGRRLTLVIQRSGAQLLFLFAGEVLDATGTTMTNPLVLRVSAAPSGTEIAFTTDCMSPSTTASLPSPLSYTVTGDQLALAYVTSSYSSVTTYTRQGCP